MNRKCYNSGRISGLPQMLVCYKFNLADDEIRNMGMIPVSPLRNGLKYSRPWLLHMAADLLMMALCGNIYLQRDWRYSRGARIEYRFARLLGKNVWLQANPSLEE